MNDFAFSLAEDLLDAIADERLAASQREASALAQMSDHRQTGNTIEMGRLSAKAERHLATVHALDSALWRCQDLVTKAAQERAPNSAERRLATAEALLREATPLVGAVRCLEAEADDALLWLVKCGDFLDGRAK